MAQAAGGVDRYIRMLLKYLDKEKFENILVCSQDFNREDYDGLVDSFEQIEMNRAIGVSDLNSIKEVRRLIKKYNPDIVYAHSSKAGAIARVADIGLKNHCVYNPHGWAFNMRCSDKKRAMYTAIEKMAAPFCEKIDTKGFRFCTEYGEEIRAMYGIPMNAFVIGHVGRFTNQKNHSKLIDIFAAIKERKSDAYLLLLGGGELQDTIKSKVEKLNLCDSVIFCGVRTDVNKYLCAMDAFVFPSTWEGLGIVAIEAQASGLECYLSRELPKEVEVTDAVTWFDVSENENAIANIS